MATATHTTPIGVLTLSASEAGVTRVRFANSRTVRTTTRDEGSAQAWSVLDRLRAELDEYLAGRRTRFDVSVDLGRVDGERRRVLETLRATVAHGETTTYGALAERAGLTGAGALRVGGFMAGNPVLIVVPCHRVVGADGSLTGYRGGVEVKRRLLDLERAAGAPGQLSLDLPAA